VVGVAVLVAAAFLFRPAARPAEITVAQAYEKYEQGDVFFLDVRRLDEWETVHIPDTTLIPLEQLETRLAEVPQDRDIVVICRSGNRSREGRDILKNAGFANVTSVNGGVNAWSAAGYPVEQGAP
jgi:rhodanese-related sulfurtransferase